jgi:hypothetical protein
MSMHKTRPIDPSVLDYFSQPNLSTHKQYLALRMFFLEGASAEEAAMAFGYKITTVYSIARNFKNKLRECRDTNVDPFFQTLRTGPKTFDREGDDAQLVIEYRKKMLSIPEIEILMSGLNRQMSAGLIEKILKENGFVRLPKRDRETKQEILRNSGYAQLVEAQPSKVYPFDEDETFTTTGAGILCFLPLIRKYDIDKVIEDSAYPGSAQVPKLNAILSFLALKLSNVERFGHDDGWCMDRGLGIFAGLNVLPKTTWFSIYSDKTTRDMNVAFLKSLNRIWDQAGLLGDTVNMDFTTIPYWGDSDPFENNWSGKRRKALASIEAVLAHDPDTGIICYGDATVSHDSQSDTVLEFLDFYHEDRKLNQQLKFLIFDSKFTVLGNLEKINLRGIKFITIQRKSKSLLEKIDNIPNDRWKTARVELANHKSRIIHYAEGETVNKGYGKGKLRQIFLKGNHVKHSTIITNEFELSSELIVRKYARRWLIENEIQEHVDFFHLNRNSSGIVVKVDFDLTMTILAHNLYRLLAKEIPRHHHMTAKTLFNHFVESHGEVEVNRDCVIVKLNLMRSTPLLIEALSNEFVTCDWIGGKQIIIVPNNHS